MTDRVDMNLVCGKQLYFMAGLFSSAGAFFTFFLLVYITFLALSSFFRFLGAISFNYDTAARMARFAEFCLD